MLSSFQILVLLFVVLLTVAFEYLIQLRDLDETKENFSNVDYMLLDKSGELNLTKCSPDCCPSTFSCSNGCVCINNKDRVLMRKRGNNTVIAYDITI
tara:strand:+ start:15431 stop:15721 length:291 start_codon:yes stop_codon:yes gene_type:complete